MNCDNVQDHVFYNTKDSLPKDEQLLVDDHLKSCHQCQQVYQLQRPYTYTIDKEKELSITPFLMTRIHVRMEEQAAPQNNWKLFSTLSTSIVAIGLFIGLFIGNFTINHKHTENQENEISYLFNDLKIENVEYKLTNN